MLLRTLLPAKEDDVKQLNVSSLNRTCWLPYKWIQNQQYLSLLVLGEKSVSSYELSWGMVSYSRILKNFKCLLVFYSPTNVTHAFVGLILPELFHSRKWEGEFFGWLSAVWLESLTFWSNLTSLHHNMNSRASMVTNLGHRKLCLFLAGGKASVGLYVS